MPLNFGPVKLNETCKRVANKIVDMIEAAGIEVDEHFYECQEGNDEVIIIILFRGDLDIEIFCDEVKWGNGQAAANIDIIRTDDYEYIYSISEDDTTKLNYSEIVNVVLDFEYKFKNS